jgi:Family of unknown function (DUF6527)
MSWIRNFVRYAQARFQRARTRVVHWIVPPYRTLMVEESLPKKLKRRTLYVVREDGFEEQAAMLCPCRCRRVLQMNLLQDERPCWRLIRHMDGTASLEPSVWRKRDCGSHFWFRHGRVEWCPGTAAPSVVHYSDYAREHHPSVCRLP